MPKISKTDNGEKILEVISDADNFNRWIYQTIKPYCKGHIFEIGSGIGNISQYLISDSYRVTLSDVNKSYVDILQKRFKRSGNLHEVLLFNFADRDIEANHSKIIESFDTVVALNVLEHVDDHLLAVKNSFSLLRPGGNLIILVPAFEALYNEFDKAVEHHRRYSVQSLKKLLSIPGFNIIHTQYFNAAGILGWYISGKIFGRKVIPSGQMSIYNKFIPLWKVADRLLNRFCGLSLICVSEKAGNK